MRYHVLYGMFGVVSHCKHSPSCGTVFLKTVKDKGLLQGFKKSFLQIITCR